MPYNIKSERVRLGLSAEDVAKDVGVSLTALYAWEVGASQPKAENLLRLSSIFDCSPEYLLGMTDERHGTIGRADGLGVRRRAVVALLRGGDLGGRGQGLPHERALVQARRGDRAGDHRRLRHAPRGRGARNRRGVSGSVLAASGSGCAAAIVGEPWWGWGAPAALEVWQNRGSGLAPLATPELGEGPVLGEQEVIVPARGDDVPILASPCQPVPGFANSCQPVPGVFVIWCTLAFVRPRWIQGPRGRLRLRGRARAIPFPRSSGHPWRGAAHG